MEKKNKIVMFIVILIACAGLYYKYDKKQKKQECFERLVKLHNSVEKYFSMREDSSNFPYTFLSFIEKENPEENIFFCPTGSKYNILIGKKFKNTNIRGYYECPVHGCHDGRNWITDQIIENYKKCNLVTKEMDKILLNYLIEIAVNGSKASMEEFKKHKKKELSELDSISCPTGGKFIIRSVMHDKYIHCDKHRSGRFK